MNKLQIIKNKLISNKRKVITFVAGVGVVIVIAVPTTLTAIKINKQNNIINQLTTDKNNLINEKNKQGEYIVSLQGEVDRLSGVEESLNNTINDLNNINLGLQQEKLNLQKANEELDEKYKYSSSQADYLKQRNEELKNEVKKNSKPAVKTSNGKKIAVDIGHNMKPDSGSVSKYTTEDKCTKEVGEALIKQLESEGYEVVRVHPTQVTSVSDSLKQRIDKANKGEVDLFLSIHFNAFDNKNSQGTEVFIHNNEDDKLRQVGERIINNFEKYGFKDRGVKTANFAVLRNAEVPAMLIECGFITSPEDMGRYEADKMAENILNGVKEVF